MRRLVLITGLLVGSLALLAPVHLAGAQGNSAAAQACQDGGHLNYTDAHGNSFKNAGQCVRHAAQGGTLVPVETRDLSLTATTLSGTGFASGSMTVGPIRYYFPEEYISGYLYPIVDEFGAFAVGFLPCIISTTGTVVIDTHDARGIEYTETFDLGNVCG